MTCLPEIITLLGDCDRLLKLIDQQAGGKEVVP